MPVVILARTCLDYRDSMQIFAADYRSHCFDGFTPNFKLLSVVCKAKTE